MLYEPLEQAICGAVSKSEGYFNIQQHEFGTEGSTIGPGVARLKKGLPT